MGLGIDHGAIDLQDRSADYPVRALPSKRSGKHSFCFLDVNLLTDSFHSATRSAELEYAISSDAIHGPALRRVV